MQGISTKTLFEQNNLKPGVDQLSSMTTRRNKKSTAGRNEIKKNKSLFINLSRKLVVFGANHEFNLKTSNGNKNDGVLDILTVGKIWKNGKYGVVHT